MQTHNLDYGCEIKKKNVFNRAFYFQEKGSDRVCTNRIRFETQYIIMYVFLQYFEKP